MTWFPEIATRDLPSLALRVRLSQRERINAPVFYLSSFAGRGIEGEGNPKL
jgi:hypothetical protein